VASTPACSNGYFLEAGKVHAEKGLEISVTDHGGAELRGTLYWHYFGSQLWPARSLPLAVTDSRFSALHRARAHYNAVQFAATEAAAKAVGVEAEILEVRSFDDFEGAMEIARTRHADAGILLSSPLVYGQLKQIAELALAKRLPLICLFPAFSKLGGLMAYGPNMEDEWRRCAGYVGRILHGAKANDLPIQRPERFDLVINLKTAAALGLPVPTLLLATASEVIE
jgi:ABC-type uncharacterized transport system substrate-binding protein